MDVDEEDFTDEGGGSIHGHVRNRGTPQHLLGLDLSDEPLDMSVSTMWDINSDRQSGPEVLRVQQEAYTERDSGQYNPQQLQSQQQAMRAFFPDVIQQSPSDSLLLSNEVTEPSDLSLLNRPVYASPTSSSTITPAHTRHGPQPAHQATQQAVTHHHPDDSSLLNLPSYSSASGSSASSPSSTASSMPTSRSSTGRSMYHQSQQQCHVAPKDNQYNARRNNDEPQAKVIRSSSILLHPSLRNLSPHRVAMALLRQDKLEVAYNLKQKCIENVKRDPDARPVSKTLWCLLELILNVSNPVSSSDMIEWVRYLVAGGDRPQDFAETVARHDKRTSCGIVWAANFLAHRCITCGISPCTSICSACFNDGDHRGHDYNLFRSQSGGACDCGSASVLKPTGFCTRHHPDYKPKTGAPAHMLLMLEQIIPHLVARLVFHLREASIDPASEGEFEPVIAADGLFAYCQELCEKNLDVEVLFRNVLCSKQAYSDFNEGLVGEGLNSNSSHRIRQSVDWYREAVPTLPNTTMPANYNDEFHVFSQELHHSTFLEELVFWMLKFEFPQKLACFLLSMRPDSVYEAAFTNAFVRHYGRLQHMLNNCVDFEAVSNGLVHVSVQLFSDVKLARRMVKEYPLMDVIITCMRQIAENVLIDTPAHGLEPLARPCKAVDLSTKHVSRHGFWPFMSDLNNLTSHRDIATQLITNDWLRHQLLCFVANFQFMNPLDKHIKSGDDSDSVSAYVTSYTCELQVTVCAVWNILDHLDDPDSEECQRLMMLLVQSATRLLYDWFNRVGFSGIDALPDKVSFHLPVHRLLVLFLSHATRVLKIPLTKLMPSFTILSLALTHPLKTMLLYHESMIGIWKSPIYDVPKQVTSYCLCTMGHNLICSDIYLMQLVAAHLRPEALIMTTMHKFGLMDLLNLSRITDSSNNSDGPDGGPGNLPISGENLRLEMFLVHMCFVAAIRTHWDRDIRVLIKRDLASQLCLADRTHSALIELMPDRLIKASSKGKHYIKKYIKKMSIYQAPRVSPAGICTEGMHRPKMRVWRFYYDPLHVLLRAGQRKSYHEAEARYHNYLRSKNIIKGSCSFAARMWPPFRIPPPVDADLADPRRVLASRTFHAVTFAFLYKAVYEDTCSPDILPFLIYLLEMTVEFHVLQKDSQGGDLLAAKCASEECVGDRVRVDQQFSSWYCTDHIFRNATTVIPAIVGDPPADSYLPSDEEMDFSEPSGDVAEIEPSSSNNPFFLPSSRPMLSLPLGSEIVPYEPNATEGNTTPETPLTPLTLTPITPPVGGSWGTYHHPRHHHQPLALPPPPRPVGDSPPAEVQDAGAVDGGAREAQGCRRPGSRWRQRHSNQSRPNLALLPPSPPPDGPSSNSADPASNTGSSSSNTGSSSSNTADSAPCPGGSSPSAVTGQEMVVAMSVEPATPTDEGVFAVPADPPPLPAPRQYPPLLAGTEVGRRGAAPPPSTTTMAPPTPSHRRTHHTGHTLPSSSAPRAKAINESLVSLLIKLFCKVSGGAPYRPDYDNISTSRIGGATHFISLLLNKMGHHDSATRDHITAVLKAADVEANRKEDDPTQEEVIKKAKEDRAKMAALRRLKVLAAFKKQQKTFWNENNDAKSDTTPTPTADSPPAAAGPPPSGDTTSSSPSSPDAASSQPPPPPPPPKVLPLSAEYEDLESRVACGVCAADDPEMVVGLPVFILPNCAEGQRRLKIVQEHRFPLTESGFRALRAASSNSLMNCAKLRYKAAIAANYHVSCQLWENRGFDHSMVAQTCGHFIHLDCQKGYFDHRRVYPDDNDGSDLVPLDPKQGEYPCTTCRSTMNATIPITANVLHWLRHGSFPLDHRPYPSLFEKHTPQQPLKPSSDHPSSYHPSSYTIADATHRQQHNQRLELGPHGLNPVVPVSSRSFNNNDYNYTVHGGRRSSLPPIQEATVLQWPEEEDTPLRVYHRLRKLDRLEYSGDTKEFMLTTYDRLIGMPLSRLKHVHDDSFNTCKLGFLSSCLRANLEAQLSIRHGLSEGDLPPSQNFDPSVILSVSMFNVISYCYQSLNQLLLPSALVRDWISDRWGLVTLSPSIAKLDTFHQSAMTSSDTAEPIKYHRPPGYYNRQHSHYFPEDDLEDLDELARRYQQGPVIPLLACDPVSLLLIFWLMLPPGVDAAAIDSVIIHCYRVAVVQATIAALRDLDGREQRERVAHANTRLGPLLALVYDNLRDHDQRVFYRHPTELENEQLCRRVEDHQKDEMLIEMRLQDLVDVKKLSKEEEKRRANLKNEDLTASEESDDCKPEEEEEQKEDREERKVEQEDAEEGPPHHQEPDVTTPEEQVEQQIRGLCLEFLRIATLLRRQLFSRPLPPAASPSQECAQLEQYLGLYHLYSIDNVDTIRVMCGLSSSPHRPQHTLLPLCLSTWCPPLIAMATTHWEGSSTLLRRQLFSEPAMMRLPKIYEFLFKFYNTRPCEKCNDKVAEPMLCLICGAVVCHTDPSNRGKLHYIQHSNSCGGAQGIFLCINKTLTILVRGPRFMIWGSLYLDINGEEDPNIKRGRTLRLNAERMQYLRHRYVTNTLDRIRGNWKFP